jgi:hypothetical protein
MIIKLEFNDGSIREYAICESLNTDIDNGLIATVEFRHPKYSEYFEIEVKKCIDKTASSVKVVSKEELK